jgi:hypothetical protein
VSSAPEQEIHRWSPFRGGHEMATSVQHRSSHREVSELIARLTEAAGPQIVEVIADQLASAGDRRAIHPLLQRLGDSHVQPGTDTEDAVCGALVALGVMCSPGNGMFYFLPRRLLADDVVDTIREMGTAIPWRYFDTKRV